MPGATSRDDIINELTTNGKRDEFVFNKLCPNACVVGQIDSLWKGTGFPGAGSNPATTPGDVHDSDASSNVVGAMWFPDRSTDLRYLLKISVLADQAGTLILYDRLAGVSGISLTSTGAKTVNSGSLSRYSGTDAVNNEAWLEMTTAITTNSLTANLGSYTSADGSTAQVGGTVVTTTANGTIGKIIPLPLAAGKRGVRSVEAGLTVGGTAPAAGVANLLIVRRLAQIPCTANIANNVSFLDDELSLPQIFDNATLGLAWQATGTTTPRISGIISCFYG